MGKTRAAFRKCRICNEYAKHRETSGASKDSKAPDNALLAVCNCAGYVHRQCQARLMVGEGVIGCLQCKTPYRGLKFTAAPKGFLRYCWEVTSGRSDLFACASLLVSMAFALVALSSTCWFELDRTWEQLTDIVFGLDLQSLGHNVNTAMLAHTSLVLPCLAVFCGLRSVVTLVSNYLIWRQTHYFVTILDEKPHKRNTPPSKEQGPMAAHKSPTTRSSSDSEGRSGGLRGRNSNKKGSKSKSSPPPSCSPPSTPRPPDGNAKGHKSE